MKIKAVIEALEAFAPLPLQESYDNAGLQVGLTEVEVSGVLLCLDITEKVIEEALEKGCNLVVSHHPLLFKGVKCISDQTQVQRCIVKAIQSGVTLYACHTNLDNAFGGVNFEIAERMGLVNCKFLNSLSHHSEGGSGLIAEWQEAKVKEDVLQLIKQIFGVVTLHGNAYTKKKIQRVALCGGSGSFLLEDAIAQGAELFITGEMSYHQYFGLEDVIQIAVIGHYESEQYTIDLLQKIVQKAFPNLSIYQTELITNPIQYL